ncbi:glycerol acyltransferase [Bacteroidia bacterium]|nr:glycerol acyltransferase [Bacteroidia bacterium]
MEIDLKNVVASKSPLLARLIPGMVWRYLHKTLHLTEINFVLTNFSHLPPAEFIRAALDYMGVDCRIEGLEELDRAGRYVFASNHPFGGLDGIILAEAVQARMGDVRIIVNDLLMNLPPLTPIFIPVNKHGRQNARTARLLKKTLEGETPVVTFPAGLCSRRRRGVVHDLPWKDNFVKQAMRYRRDIVPVFVEGRLSDFFYRLSNLRTSLGIKANIEMLYLVDEMFRQKGKTFRIRVGEPIPWQQVDGWGLPPARAAAKICQTVYGMQPGWGI